MAKKSKLNTNLDGKKGKVEDDDIIVNQDDLVTDIDDETQDAVPVEVDDDITYTMGDIKVSDNSDDEEEKLDLKKIKEDEEDDEDWVDEESIQDDYDPYLDDANYDGDNPNPYSDNDF